MKKAEQQKITAYCFLLAAALLLVAGILGTGNIQASYVNKAVWNTVIHPREPVTSNCLTSDGQVILLGELTEQRQIEVWLESPVEDIGELSLEWKDPTHEAYLTASLAEDTVRLSKERTYGYIDLTPTDLALELEEDVEIEILVTMTPQAEGETLYGVFRLTLPGKEIEKLKPGETGIRPGETAVLTFAFEEVFNVDGIFLVSDVKRLISEYDIYVEDAGETDAVVEEDRLWAVPPAEPTKTDVSVSVEVTLKEDAAPGEMCTVSFVGIYGDGNDKPGNEVDIYQTMNIVVLEPEPEVIGSLAVNTLADFSLNGSLPASMTLPEDCLMLTATLADDELPAFTRYSVDGGESWYMLYDAGQISVDAAEMPVFESGQSLLLDMYHTEWDRANPLRLSVIAHTEEGMYSGEVVSEATASLLQSQSVTTPLIINTRNSLAFSVSENWAECETNVYLTHLEPDDVDSELLYREVTDDSIRINIDGNYLSVQVGDTLPPAGTYCLTISYYYGGICFAESEITFFVNYSSVT